MEGVISNQLDGVLLAIEQNYRFPISIKDTKPINGK